MGPVRRRDAALTPDLAATFAALADAMASARHPWWVIGSAAATLHGVDAAPRDVDVVLSIEEFDTVAARTGAVLRACDDNDLFRSDRFATWRAHPVPVEFMAGFRYRAPDGWRAVLPATRERVAVGSRTVFVPSRRELADLMRAFGRPKDLARAALLR